MSDRVQGVLLFLPVPVVLVLFTQAPLGAPASLALGALLMVTHRLYARPFALARSGRRCLWCGAPAGEGPAMELAEPGGGGSWRACQEAHAQRLVRFVGWAESHALALRLGILGALGVFLPAALLADARRLGPLTFSDAVAFFRIGVALSVLPLGFAGAGLGVARPRPRAPFPLHVPALLGTYWVAWLFRVVGVVWLVAGGYHVLSRAAAPATS